MKMIHQLYWGNIVMALVLFVATEASFSQSTAFTYQGQLTENGQPATGRYDLKFALYDVPTGGVALGAVTNVATDVSNGLFTVTLDFGGAVFTGAARWLELGAVTNGGGDFNALSPRQAVTATPYAVRALTVSSNALADYAGAVALLNPANTFVGSFGGDGSSVSNVNATTVGGLTASNFWQLGGNAGTAAGTHFVGTTDNQPLELRVNGVRAFRLEPTAGAPNVIGGSSSNVVSVPAQGVTISGGTQNSVASNASFTVIAGGNLNVVRAEQYQPVAATIGGGMANFVGGPGSTIGAGVANTVWQHYATIGGGRSNYIDSFRTGFATYDGVIAGGQNNKIGYYSDASAIGGGAFNEISGESSSATIAGGGGNRIGHGSDGGSVGGGTRNIMGDFVRWAVISGGYSNRVGMNSHSSTIGGGSLNKIEDWEYGTIGGGGGNYLKSQYGVISGGLGNSVFGTESSVAGGRQNTIGRDSQAATIGGGRFNVVQTNAHFTTIGGGYGNELRNATNETGRVDPVKSTIGGGASNVVYEAISVIGGGVLNIIGQTNSRPTDGGHVIAGGSVNWITSSNTHSSIGGGMSNLVDATYATIAGGYSNRVSGNYAMIAGGEQNAATTYGFAAGRRAKANHAGAFVWADATDADLVSTNENSVTMRAAGGYRLYSDSAEASGVYLAVGGGSWTSISDRNAKENFRPVDVEAVLSKVAALPLSFWNYKTQDEAIQHLGPMAQDFRAAFGLGESATGITTIDADGVALAAIQGLNQKVEDRNQQADTRIRKLEAENAMLKERLEKLEQVLSAGGLAK